jgi:hypothetical protein
VSLPTANDYFFTQGNGSTINGTQVPSYWVNKVGGEWDNLIEACYSLNMSSYNQGLSCINSLIANAVAAIPSGPTPHGLLLRTTAFYSTSTFTPLSGTNSIQVEVQAAGGSGGSAPATTASQFSAGSGGAAGSYAWVQILSGVTAQTVTIGGSGVATSFGSLVSCPAGGTAIGIVEATGYVGQVGQSLSGGSCTISGPNLIVNGAGQPGPNGFFLNTGVASGQGAPSHFGGGGSNTNGAAGGTATSPGAGGGGAACQTSCAGYAGGGGGPAVVIVREYS